MKANPRCSMPALISETRCFCCPEQPLPLMVRTSCGKRPSSATAVLSALRTPKSPQPGHQSGSAFPLKSLTVSAGRRGRVRSWDFDSIWISPMQSSSNADLVHRHVPGRLAGEDLFHAAHHVMGHERLPVVLADMRVRRDARLGTQVTGELAAVIV